MPGRTSIAALNKRRWLVEKTLLRYPDTASVIAIVHAKYPGLSRSAIQEDIRVVRERWAERAKLTPEDPFQRDRQVASVEEELELTKSKRAFGAMVALRRLRVEMAGANQPTQIQAVHSKCALCDEREKKYEEGLLRITVEDRDKLQEIYGRMFPSLEELR